MILGVIALIVVGPKELPGLLRTIGRYAGVMKRHASEFRSHFDQVLKEAELDKLKSDITGFKSEMEGAARDALRTAEKQADSANRAMNETGKPAGKAASEPDPFDDDEVMIGADGSPIEVPARPAKPFPNHNEAAAAMEKAAAADAEPAAAADTPEPQSSGAAKS